MTDEPRGGADEDRSGLDSAPRRTLLAAERTYLAWLRTGLGAIGVSLAVGRLIPALLDSDNVGYALLGIGYGLLGGFLIAYALLRARHLQAALARNERVTLDWWALSLVTLVGLALAVATIAMVLAEV
jgi:putative membrane protein